MFTVTQGVCVIHIDKYILISVVDSEEKQTKLAPRCRGITSDLHSSSRIKCSEAGILYFTYTKS
jgi:hypothetical protein